MGLVRANARVLLAGVALTAMASAQVAQAQEANRNASFMTLLERIVLGAGKEKVAIDTPQAVTVVTQDDIDAEQAVTTGELVKGVPGVTMVGSDRFGGEAFNIRGIGQTESPSDQSRIVVNVDGQPKFFKQYRMGSFFGDPELYKQVEVLRGSASSTLYGAGALGGVINFTTKDASDFIKEGKDGALRLKTTYEDNGNALMSSAVLAQRISETFEVLEAVNYRATEDFTKASGEVLTGSAFDSWSGLLKGKAWFGDNNEQSLTASYQRLNFTADKTRLSQTGLNLGTNGYENETFGYIDVDTTDETFVLAWDNPDSDNPWIDSHLQLSYSHTLNERRNARTSAGVIRTPTPPATALSSTYADSDYWYRTWQLKGDNTVEWVTDEFENYFTFGFQASTQDRGYDYPNGVATPDVTTHPQGTENKFGVFAQDEFTWNKLTITPGIRADWHSVTALNNPGEVSGEAFSPKLAALYELTDNINLFGSVAHTERLPSIDELFAFSGSEVPNLDLKKEGANSVEAGFAIHGDDLFISGDSYALKATAFYSQITDMIATTPSSDAGTKYYDNISEAEIAGFEVEGSYNSEFVFASLAYSHTKGTDLSDPDNPAPLQTVPQDKLVLTAGLRNPEWNLEGGARVTLAAEGDYVDNATTGNPPRPYYDGTAKAWSTVDLFASWKPTYGPLEGTEILASVDNVFNADYRENLERERSKGRTFKLTLSKQFDY